MANEEQFKLLKQDVQAWNTWRKKHHGELPDLSGANLFHADLLVANLSGAGLRETTLANVDLTDVRGLEDCHHLGPSIIDFRALAYGPLPLVFLRGCGLPETVIDYLPSLVLDSPIQFYSCFISYSSKDEEFAQRLHADLQNKGVRCWFAPEDIQGGKKIHEQIDAAIRIHEKLLLILSEYSMQSEWVKAEIANARQREKKEKVQVLFPIRLVDYDTILDWTCFDADTGKDSAREIREYFIPDFSNWKSHDAYMQAFDRLLRDLKPEAGQGTKV